MDGRLKVVENPAEFLRGGFGEDRADCIDDQVNLQGILLGDGFPVIRIDLADENIANITFLICSTRMASGFVLVMLCAAKLIMIFLSLLG